MTRSVQARLPSWAPPSAVASPNRPPVDRGTVSPTPVDDDSLDFTGKLGRGWDYRARFNGRLAPIRPHLGSLVGPLATTTPVVDEATRHLAPRDSQATSAWKREAPRRLTQESTYATYRSSLIASAIPSWCGGTQVGMELVEMLLAARSL